MLDEVYLRRPEIKDVDFFYAYRNDWEVISSLGGFSRGYSTKDLQDWLEYHRKQQNEIIWTIAEKCSDNCLGHVGLYNIEHRVRHAEFAIMLGNKKWWGKGLGNQITYHVIDYGFKQLNLHKVYLTVLKSNERAIALYHKLGLTIDGTLRADQYRDGHYQDSLLMSVLENEWCAR